MRARRKDRSFMPDLMIPRVSKVMSTPVVKVDAGASAVEATVLMLDHGVGGLVVTRNGVPAGIFTRRDLHKRVLAAKRDMEDTRIEQVMTTPIITITSNASLKEAMDLMKKNAITRLGVMKDDDL
ncbi:MAG: CBS domain-containing protein, partial [Aigarchaeota archaeon]|nr:CBS domain-containing protein [Aigarchaeota archaeon]